MSSNIFKAAKISEQAMLLAQDIERLHSHLKNLETVDANVQEIQKSNLKSPEKPAKSPEKIEKVKLYTEVEVNKIKDDIEKETRKKLEQKITGEAKKKFEKKIELLEKALEQAGKIKEELHKDLGKVIAPLSMKIAAKILKAEIKIDKNVVTRTVLNVLTECIEDVEIIIKVNPEDLKILENDLTIKELMQKRELGIQFIGDREIKQGGCILLTKGGEIDARIETQENQIRTLIDDFYGITNNMDENNV